MYYDFCPSISIHFTDLSNRCRPPAASRHPSSNNSDSNNLESSLEDSGVVDDQEGGDVTSEDVIHIPHIVQVI